MRKDEDVVNAIKDYQQGRPVRSICKAYNISNSGFYNWLKQAGVKPKRHPKQEVDWDRIREVVSNNEAQTFKRR